MKGLRQKLLEVFQLEYQDHLARIRSILEDPASADGAGAPSQIDEAFRSAHSLKGAARAVDLFQVETLSHRLETLFSFVKKGKLPFTRELTRSIHTVLDRIEDLASAPQEEGTPEPEIGPVLQLLDAILADGAAAAGGTAPAPPAVAPSPAAEAELPAHAPPPIAAESLRIDSRHLDELLRSASLLLTEHSRQQILAQHFASFTQELASLERDWDLTRKTLLGILRAAREIPGSSRLEERFKSVERRLLSLSGRSRGLQHLQQQSAWSLQQLSETLQGNLRTARMVPASSVFEGFGKMVRDLARTEQKEVDFTMEGLELEADRVVLQALKDPLMHMLRNAVGHAIELPEQRTARHKPRQGRVHLELRLTGNRLTLILSDDGKGFDLEKISALALQKGLFSREELSALTPADLLRLTFQAGFSTSPYITELSGRGMGLSVVWEAVSRLQGEIEILPQPEHGTAIRITTPLSIATHHLILAAWQGETYAIPTHGIERLDQIASSRIEFLEERPVIRHQGTVIPLLTLSHLLQLEASEVHAEETALPIVVLKSGHKRLAVVVDRLLGQTDGLIKDLGAPFARLPQFAGGLLLGDGSVALVLNPTALIEGFRNPGASIVVKTAPKPQASQAPTILVVDDSITTRTLEKSILEAHGYQVSLAVDGLEALSVLRSHKPDLIISDIQMPRMDGFGLLAETKKQPELASIPFILLTSLESREDQERGLSLGADAYVVKRKFDQRNLLDTIRQIL